MNKKLIRLDHLTGLAFGLLALGVYWVTCSAGAYPGASARELTRCLGITPALTPESPLWRWISGLIGQTAGADAVAALNAFAVVCGAAAVWLTYRVTSLALSLNISRNEVGGTMAQLAAVVGGASAALFLTFCMPFWVSGTRAGQAPFHTVLLLASAWLFLAWFRDARKWQLLLAWSLCGIGVVEFVPFIPFVPLMAGYTLYRLWVSERLDRRSVLEIGLAAILPLSLYAVASALFVSSEGYELRAYESFGSVVWVWWRDQFNSLRYGLPQVGWLLVLCLTVVPWLTVLAVGRHSLNCTRDVGLTILHLVLAGVIVVLTLNLKISPWKLMGWGQSMVTPYLLAALVCGYLAAYALLLPQAWWTREPVDTLRLRRRRDRIGAVLVLPFVVVLLVAPFRNAPEADARRASLVNELAGRVVEAAGGREWLITDGTMDSHILLAAREKGKRLETINLFDRSDIYMRQLARRFSDPSYRNMMQVSTPGFVREWLMREPSAAGKVAVFSEPDLWLAAGFTTVPSKLLYLGESREVGGSAIRGDLLEAHRAFWSGLARKPSGSEIAQPADWLAARMLRHAGAVANNLGVFLEDAGRTNDAFLAYQAARKIDPENLSALLNLGVLVDHGFRTEATNEIRAEIAALQKTVKQKMHAWTLSRYYGYVRVPELYVQVGWNWVLSGQPGMGVSRLLKAVELSNDATHAQVAQQALAYAFLSQNEPEAGETVYRAALQRDPSNIPALIGLARIDVRNRNFPSAASRLEKAEKEGAPARTVAFDWVALHLASGNAAKARVLLERMVDEDPGLLRAWAILAGVLSQEKDAHGVQRCLQRLDSVKDGAGIAALVRARIAMDEMDLAGARRNAGIARKAMPGHVGTVEMLVRLDLLEAKQDLARTHSLELLRLRPNHALGNYVIGTIQLNEGKLDLAEDSLRRSMAVEKTPAVLNDLGWLLYTKGDLPGAEKLTREALAMRPDMYQAWDTLAAILIKTGKLDEADEALRKALAISADDPVVHLHKVELLMLRGQKDAARQVLMAIKDKRDFLPLEEKLRYDQLKLALNPGDS